VLTEAVTLAKSNTTDLNKMAAIIVKRKRVLGRGFNSRRSHPMQKLFSKREVKIALHAEIAAIVDALRTNTEEELKGATIYVARVLKNGSRAKAKPCEICQRAIKTYGIEAVFWTEYEDRN
jgi:tRNA(Arg) A34 adenosine deaminase TadA